MRLRPVHQRAFAHASREHALAGQPRLLQRKVGPAAVGGELLQTILLFHPGLRRLHLCLRLSMRMGVGVGAAVALELLKVSLALVLAVSLAVIEAAEEEAVSLAVIEAAEEAVSLLEVVPNSVRWQTESVTDVPVTADTVTPSVEWISASVS